MPINHIFLCDGSLWSKSADFSIHKYPKSALPSFSMPLSFAVRCGPREPTGKQIRWKRHSRGAQTSASLFCWRTATSSFQQHLLNLFLFFFLTSSSWRNFSNILKYRFTICYLLRWIAQKRDRRVEQNLSKSPGFATHDHAYGNCNWIQKVRLSRAKERSRARRWCASRLFSFFFFHYFFEENSYAKYRCIIINIHTICM